MHPLTIATFAISGTILFVSSAFMVADTPIPFFSTEEEKELIADSLVNEDKN